MAGERLSALMQKRARLEQESFGAFISKEDDVTWQEIWEAACEDKIITPDTSGSQKILLISPSRRGPVTASDIDTFTNTVEQTGITHHISPRIPHALTGQIMGYLVNGLPSDQQIDMLNAIQVESINGQMHLSSEGDPLLELSQKEGTERIWTREGSQVQVSKFKEIVGRWTDITAHATPIHRRLIDRLPNECTLEEAVAALTSHSLEVVLEESGHSVKVDASPPKLKPSSLKKMPANAAEDSIRSAVLTATSVKETGWYGHFENGIRKALKNSAVNTEQAAMRIWNKVIDRSPQAKTTFDFSLEDYLKEVNAGIPQIEAFLASVKNRASLGSILLEQTTHAIRNAQNKGSEVFTYVPGKTMFGNYLDTAGADPNMAIGFQPFDSRGDTGFMLQRLASVTEERGKPIPAIVMASRDQARHDHSIFEALRDL